MLNYDFSCVIVTYDRLNKLKQTLRYYDALEFFPKNVIIVDNASNIDTKVYLDNWQNKKGNFNKFVIHLPQNIGGSGGFHVGMKKAMQLVPDWIFVGDDDAYPKADCFKIINNFFKKNKNFTEKNIAAVCTSVYEENQVSKSHRRVIKNYGLFIKDMNVDEDKYSLEQFELDLFSYVGAAIRKDILFKVGLPEKDFFIYYDDTEHSIRVRSEGKVYCIPKAIMYHDVKKRKEVVEIDWRKFYSIRNKLVCYKLRFGMPAYSFALVEICKAFIKIGLNHNAVEFRLRISAIIDGIKMKMGVHPLYKPGWKL